MVLFTFRVKLIGFNCLHSNFVSKNVQVIDGLILKILPFVERIQSAPLLVTGYPKPVTARTGDNVELECLEKPNSQVSHYRWLKTDSLIKANHTNPFEKDNVNWLSPQMYRPFEIQHGETELNGVKLELKLVTKKDTGYYTCFLSNSNGFTFGTAFLNVKPILPTGIVF